MKLLEVIELGDNNTDPAEAAKLIKRDCPKFLREAEDLFDELYRGLSVFTWEHWFQEVKVKPDRKPMDLPLIAHNAFNRWMIEDFNTAYRSEALFCTGKRSWARQFGLTYSIFPVGDFKYLWSPVIKDLFTYYDDRKASYEQWSMNEIREIYDDAEYTENELRRAIAGGHEIMVVCEKAYAVIVDKEDDGQQISHYDVRDVVKYV